MNAKAKPDKKTVVKALEIAVHAIKAAQFGDVSPKLLDSISKQCEEAIPLARQLVIETEKQDLQTQMAGMVEAYTERNRYFESVSTSFKIERINALAPLPTLTNLPASVEKYRRLLDAAKCVPVGSEHGYLEAWEMALSAAIQDVEAIRALGET